MKMDLDALLLQESRRTPDLSGCKSADELLKSVLNKTNEKLTDEMLDMLYAAGNAVDKTMKTAFSTPGPDKYK